MSLPPGRSHVLDELAASAKSVEGTFFRSVEITYSDLDESRQRQRMSILCLPKISNGYLLHAAP